MNKVIIIGRLTADPEIKQIGSAGHSVCKFSIALSDKFGEKEHTNFFVCEAWSKQAELIGEWMKKGYKILVDGRLKQELWEKEGKKQSTVKIVVERFENLQPKSEAVKSNETVSSPFLDNDLPF